MPRAIVTGGAGFIGSHVVDALLEQGYGVDVIDDLSTGKRENLASAARLHVVDVRSPEAARLVASGVSQGGGEGEGEGDLDLVIHLAAQMDVRKSVADPLHDASVNILGSINVLEAVRRLPPGRRPRVIFSSTGGVLYGDFVTPPNAEETPKDPESPYAIAKLSTEYYLAYYARVHGLEAVSLRYGNVYGPRQDPHGEAGVVAIFCGRLLDRRPLTVFGTGRQTRDYVYVGDVARATLAAATRPLPPVARLDARAFNVGTGTGTSVLTLADILRRASGIDVPIEFAPARAGEQEHSYVRVEKAARILDWRPLVSLEDGLHRTFRWFDGRQLAGSPA